MTTHIPDDPRGWLRFDWLPEDLQNAEDATQAADKQRVREGKGMFTSFTRPATTTERTLLESLDYALPAQLATTVRWISPGVRNRRWIALENGS
jgi:hypothetical protein